MSEHLSTLLAQIQNLHSELDRAVDEFMRSPKKRTVACPPSCGKCCLGFDPAVTQAEALSVADFILRKNDQELFKRVESPLKNTTCKFYDDLNPHHCTIYEARPLVCRGFGYTSYTDKLDQSVFQYCKHMPTEGPRTLEGPALKAAFSQVPPRMADFGVRSESIAPENEPLEKLSQAIGPTMAKLALVRRLQELPTKEEQN